MGSSHRDRTIYRENEAKEKEKRSPRITTLNFLRQLTNGPNKLVIHYSMLEMLVRDKHSSFFNPFVLRKNEVLCVNTTSEP